ncbi:MAG: molecular chaperone HtpG [Candidatus Cloacimonetes bacterium]|nr:molecular chaperone HtpG [Candidatus Cloacimonadota bacterium]
MSDTKPKKPEHGSLSIHTDNIFPIIKKWLYSEHDIFLRELVSNAVDATSKRKAAQPKHADDEFKVVVKLDKDARTISVSDSGIGMTGDEIKKYINQIAFSGAEEFVSKFKDRQASIIGHFGLGFYSSFMVAEKVTIDSLSYKPGAKAALWECDGTTEYTLGRGERTEVGTTVTVHINKENEQYLDESKLREMLERYCNFMPYPIELSGNVINQTEALWLRHPKDVTDDEYKQFYKDMFHEWEEPLFWIHLNVDFPFNLKGILYFPRLRNELDYHRGSVKLYCNNVFVADNLKEFVPEFLLLLRGGIDVPDISLNVSRSFLQQDAQVRKISKYIIKKVADRLNELFREDRKRFEELWDDIQQFIKFGVITNEDFFEAMKDILVFKTSKDEWVTLEEYKERNPQTAEKPAEDDKDGLTTHKIYYSPGEDTQVTYLKLMSDQGIEVIYTTSAIDTHLFQNLESKLPFTRFVRIDSEVLDGIVNTDKKELVDADDKTESDKVKAVFERALDNEQITVEPKSLKTPEIPAMVVFNEHMRRFQEMSHLMPGGDKMDMPANHTLVVNTENASVKKALRLDAAGSAENADILCRYLHQLALLEQKAFDGQQLQAFIANANRILGML